MGSGGRREAQEGTDVCILTTDSWRCIAESNTILETSYPSI